MVALLKQKSKITVQHKQRVKYEIKNIFKRPKIDDNLNKDKVNNTSNALGFSGTGKTAGKIVPTIIEKYDTEMTKPTKE